MLSPEQRFSNFWTALQNSNEIWFDLIKLKFSKKDLPDIAQKLLIELYAEGYNGKDMDWKQAQNRFAKMLTWAPDKVEPVPQHKAEPVVIHPEAVTGEKRDEWIDKFLKAHLSCTQTMTQRAPSPYEKFRNRRGEIYHPDPEAGRIADLKISYGILHTDKYTGKTLEGHPTWDEYLKTQTGPV